jgi:hypothetical protein
VDARWQLLIYRLPTTPSRTRVAVWRELRRLGALPLQQSVAVVPELGGLVKALDAIEARIRTDGGTAYRFVLGDLTPEQRARLEREWTALRVHEFAEIIEECETKFRREVEFEIFRGNLTGSEAEEIEADLEKIQVWFARVAERDWFGAANRAECEAAIAESQRLLEDFVERVFLAEAAGGPSLELPARLSWDESPRPVDGADNAPGGVEVAPDEARPHHPAEAPRASTKVPRRPRGKRSA